MISKVWAGLILASACVVAVNSIFFDHQAMQTWVNALFEMSELSVDIALGLVGALCFWMGLFKIAEVAGIIEQLGRLLQPLLSRLMPSVPPGHPAMGSMTMNIAANIFGLDNAATPMGLKAMEHLQSLNPSPKTLSDAQLLFVVLNTSSVTLLPVTILMYRVEMGAAHAADVLLPIILATSCSTFVGVSLVIWRQKLRIISKGFFLALAAYIIFLVSLIVLGKYQPQGLNQIGPAILMLTVAGIIATGLYRRIPVYDHFIEGAQEGFGLAVKIIPYLVAMLVAVGLLRASGALDYVLNILTWLLGQFGIGDDFVGALPTAFMKPFSGSGARALMLETMEYYGVDSIQGRIAAVVQGSTETTFYVLTVYLGVVGIQRSRYLISTCLIADVAGCTSAIIITQLFF